MSQLSVSEILQPLYIDDAEQHAWDEQCELLVVGWGAAGACAALEGQAQGLDVLIVDRFKGGGASIKSGGIVYAGGGTRQQQMAGFKDTPEAMFEYLRHETQGVVTDATLRRFCENSVSNLQWLESHGARYDFSMPPGGGKTSYPADGYYLYYSGNEAVEAYAGTQPPAPRGHRTVGKGQSGRVLYEALQQSCQRLGIRSLLQSAVRRLVVDSSGRVVGAEVYSLPAGSPVAAKHAKLAAKAERLQNFRPDYCDTLREQLGRLEREHARPRLVRAKRGLVLSTGGFVFNPQMMSQHGSKYLRNFKLGATGCDGSAVRLGGTVGAAVGQMDKISAWRFLNPPMCWPKGIVVNKQGQRFCNEEVYGATLGAAMCEDHGGEGWLILDRKLRRQALWETLKGGYWWFQTVPALMLMWQARKGRTLSELAAATGMDPEQLEAEVSRYNLAARGKAAEPFGKSAGNCQVLDQGPFYACDISVGNAVFPMSGLTLGGLKVDEDSGAVLNAQGQPIAGLYAAGRAAVGIPSHLYVSGLSLADCVFSGRRAAQAAAADLS
ncbi:FAD-binding protein [Pseudomonas sp. TTU2014-080ASC]|uniref:FAD-binding protein n=1 Tax=Pseudomonas sp. TTU2014-080ASC TaxID=1729724 RepID=UPI000718A39A|nr:FAD-binding protein [Pseudomonas sp. TTU2014-080ASC]KRW58443.1 delta 4, 5-alpha steroid dehydrogenase [Pseudomonas sp. TTU2014-080ASC]